MKTYILRFLYFSLVINNIVGVFCKDWCRVIVQSLSIVSDDECNQVFTNSGNSNTFLIKCSTIRCVFLTHAIDAFMFT